MRISELLNTIERQTEYLFVYNKRNVDLKRFIHIEENDLSVSEVLDDAFKNTDIKYIMEGNNIVLTKIEEMETVISFLQNRVTITGVVTDMKGEAIIGANILEKGTSNGVITNPDGRFSLHVAKGSELTVSYIGYKSQTISIDNKTTFSIRLEEEALALETVVVTAMGIRKKEASLTYAAQLVYGNELTNVKDPNFIFSLAGKTAGVQINRISSGLASSAKVSIRGARSLSGNNQPLYVIDGVPMLNNSNEQASTIMGGIADAGNRDGGDGISNINPDDIESMSVLKGASAAALYGSQAANGVILITTRKGKPGLQQATFSSNTTFDRAISLPEFQNTYGIDSNNMSWGSPDIIKKYNNLEDFFQKGFTTINSVSLTKGKEDIQNYFSYANTYGKGIIGGNKLTKHNITFRETGNFFNNRLSLDANINLIQQTLKNRPVTGGLYMNPLVSLYAYPRGEDLSYYKNKFEVFNADRNLYTQNWYRTISGFEQNPYWITNRALNEDQRFRTIGNLSANLKLTYWLTLQARASVDYINDKYEQKMLATTAQDIAGTYTPENSEVAYANGRYINLNHTELLMYADAMLLLDKTWNNWSLNGALGVSINHTTINSLRLDSKIASLYYPNIFTVSNIVMNSNANIEEKIKEQRELQSIFGTAQVGWKERLYLDVTARNDWSSTLAYTRHSSFFYPSVGISWIFSNTMRLPKWISYSKIRSSWSQVGNDLPLFYSKLEDRVSAGGDFQANHYGPFDELKPELSSSFEIGTEWRFFNHRVDVDLTWYRTITRNQLVTLPSSAGALYKYYMVNAGKIENKGYEITLGVIPILNPDFYWKTTVNFSTNKNKVIKLHPELKVFQYGPEGFSMHYAMKLREGGSFGDIYGWKFDRDENGNIKLDETGLPQSIGSGNTEKIGNSSPDFMLGWGHSLSYKNFSLNFLIDARVGGDMVSMTQGELDYRGVSRASGQAREQGYVELEGHQYKDIEGFYQSVSTRNSLVTEYYMYSATNIRLREASISYSVPQSFLEKTKIVKSINLSLIGRNLFFIYKKAPFDPDLTLSTNNDNQGVDTFNPPPTRSIGFNIRFVF